MIMIFTKGDSEILNAMWEGCVGVVNSKDLIVELEGNVLCLTLNRPEVLNAFSREMMDGIMEALKWAKASDEIRAIVLSGAGRAFSSGGDIKKKGNSTPVSTYDHLSRSKELILAMSELEVPIVAAVHGYAAGGGACLAVACDIILAAEDSKFFFSFAKIGLIPDTGGMFFLPRTLGLYRAKELMFNPKPLEAATAYQWGMVNHIFPADQLLEEAKRYARELAAGPSRAIGYMKKVANQALVSDLSEVLQMEATTQAVVQSTEDHKEGIRAFIEKRKPSFQGR
jgi:2-(1,2-epoxy-1,2-dihydrophenyl)acetyl-CoA isomerase